MSVLTEQMRARRRRIDMVRRALSTRELVTSRQLAEAVGVCQRSVWRYVSVLRERGWRIASDPGVGYMLRGRSR